MERTFGYPPSQDVSQGIRPGLSKGLFFKKNAFMKFHTVEPSAYWLEIRTDHCFERIEWAPRVSFPQYLILWGKRIVGG